MSSVQKATLIWSLAAALLLGLPIAGPTAAAATRRCTFESGSKFPSVTDLRTRRTTCQAARRLAREVQDNGSSLQPLIYLRGKRWKAKYTTRTAGDAVWYSTVLRSGERVVTMNLGS